MLISRIRSYARALAVFSAVAISPAAMGALPDAGLFTTYSLSNGYTQVSFVVCGYLPQSDGCYGSGSLGPFGHVGAILEGYASVVGDAVNRSIYVVDIAAGSTGDQVVLYRYQKTDTVSNGSDQVTTKLTKTVQLPLVGGVNARCSIAGNAKYVYIGTDQSSFAVQVTKGSLAVGQVGGFSNNPTVASITTNDAGDIVVTFGADAGGPGGIVVLGPNGQFLEDGGGASFTLTSTQGLSTKDLPTYLGAVPANLNGSLKPRSTTAPATTSGNP
jgi:hypothetical protein